VPARARRPHPRKLTYRVAEHGGDPVPAQNCKPSRMIEDFPGAPPYRRGMITILSALVSLLSFRVRNRASLELELVALRHQVIVLR
jgi:hypothetical protein